MDKINIKLSEGQKLFFTSDFHLNHKNVIGFTNRPFKDLLEMHQEIISRWNAVVGAEDIVFNLGDLLWSGSRRFLEGFVERLNGTKYYILGNHDDPDKMPSGAKLYDTVHLAINNNPTYVLSHYPLFTWQGRDKGVCNLHGHIHLCHTKTNTHEDHLLPYHWNQYDVGVDNNFFKPVERNEIIQKLHERLHNEI